MKYRLPTKKDYEILKEYVIEHYSNGEKEISASNKEIEKKETEIGFSLGSKYQGYATETIKAIIKYLLFDCDLDKVKGGCFLYNHKSAKTMLNVGMKELQSNDSSERHFYITKENFID